MFNPDPANWSDPGKDQMCPDIRQGSHGLWSCPDRFPPSSLIIELVVLGFFTFGSTLQRKGRYREHGFTMPGAGVRHRITVPAVMTGSFLSMFGAPAGFTCVHPLNDIIPAHAMPGPVALAPGEWLVGASHLKKEVSTCFPQKPFMRGAIPDV
jgi:hypothetical protein